MGYEVNNDKARQRAVSGGNDLKAFAQGLYVCEVIKYEVDEQNSYQGTPRPTCKFQLSPIRPALGGELKDIDGEPLENWFETSEGKTYRRFFQFYVSLPPSLGKKTNFSKLVTAIFGNQAPTYTDFDQYIGNTVVADISVTSAQVDDGSVGKITKMFNKVESLSNDPQNVIGQTQAAVPQPVGAVPAAPVDAPAVPVPAPNTPVATPVAQAAQTATDNQQVLAETPNKPVW